jgi:hypothetical protein
MEHERTPSRAQHTAAWIAPRAAFIAKVGKGISGGRSHDACVSPPYRQGREGLAGAGEESLLELLARA